MSSIQQESKKSEQELVDEFQRFLSAHGSIRQAECHLAGDSDVLADVELALANLSAVRSLVGQRWQQRAQDRRPASPYKMLSIGPLDPKWPVSRAGAVRCQTSLLASF